MSEQVTEDGAERVLVGELTLHFRDDGIFDAYAGCNELGGEYRIEDGLFVAEYPLFMTKIGCFDELGEQEDWYIAFLTSSPHIELDGDVLVLEGEGTRVEYLDEDA